MLSAALTTLRFHSFMHYCPRVMKLSIRSRGRSSFLYILHGLYRYDCENGSFTASDGDLVILPHGAAYSYQVMSGEDTEVMQVEFDLLQDGTSAAFAHCPMTAPHEKCGLWQEAFSNLAQQGNTAVLRQDCFVTAQIYLLLSVVPQETTGMEPENKIAPAEEYLRTHVDEDVSLQHLAELCYLSRSQLCRLFRTQHGKSPQQYAHTLKIEAAQKLLLYSYSGIGEIGRALGFGDIFSFSRFFKRETGKSPSAWRSENTVDNFDEQPVALENRR